MYRILASLLIGLVLAPATAQVSEPDGGRGRPAVSAVAALRDRMPEIEFDQVPLSEVFRWIGSAHSINIVVRWERLENAGVERDLPISLTAKNLRLSQVLWMIMNQVSESGVPLAYRADREMILISTAEHINEGMLTKVYDVSDLVAPRLQQSSLIMGRRHDVVVGNTVTVAAGAVAVQPTIGQVNSGIYWGHDPRFQLQNDDLEGDPEQEIQELIDTIVSTIAPDSWVGNGGRGTIRAYRGNLVVRNSPLVHQQIGGFLSQRDVP